MQLYLPPAYSINKDFLRQVLNDEKKLLRLDEVKRINVPFFDELSVKNIYPQVKDDPDIASHFCKETESGRLPEREYFFNVVNTHQPEYMKLLVDHALKQRNSAEGQE